MKEQDKIVKMLTEAGALEVPARSKKYRKFSAGRYTLWVGRCGALREGETLARSMSIGPYQNADELSEWVPSMIRRWIGG